MPELKSTANCRVKMARAYSETLSKRWDSILSALRESFFSRMLVTV